MKKNIFIFFIILFHVQIANSQSQCFSNFEKILTSSEFKDLNHIRLLLEEDNYSRDSIQNFLMNCKLRSDFSFASWFGKDYECTMTYDEFNEIRELYPDVFKSVYYGNDFFVYDNSGIEIGKLINCFTTKSLSGLNLEKLIFPKTFAEINPEDYKLCTVSNISIQSVLLNPAGNENDGFTKVENPKWDNYIIHPVNKSIVRFDDTKVVRKIRGFFHSNPHNYQVIDFEITENEIKFIFSKNFFCTTVEFIIEDTKHKDGIYGPSLCKMMVIKELLERNNPKEIEDFLFAKINSAQLGFVMSLVEQYGKECMNLTNSEGNNALMILIKNDLKGKRLINLKLLLMRLGANEYINTTNNEGKNALIIAIEKYDKDIVKLCLEYGADIFINDKNGKSPLMYSLMEYEKNKITGHNKYAIEDIIELLLEKSVKQEIQKGYFDEPLIYSVERFSYEHGYESKLFLDVIKNMLENGASIDIVNNHWANEPLNCYGYFKSDLKKLLRSYGAKIKIKKYW